jgi:hypothetical protein
MNQPSPQANNVLVETLGSSLQRGGNALADVPGLLKRLLVEDAWRTFTTRRGELVEHERFAGFVAAPPLRGLGATVDLIKRIVEDDKATLDLLDQALQNPSHVHADVNNINVRPQGTSRDQALRKLREDAPELHADVLAGNVSPHAAMVKAGYRPRTGTVRYDDPESAARSLRKHMPADTRRALAKLLLDD